MKNIELTEISATCTVISNNAPYKYQGSLKIELIKSHILSQQNYTFFLRLISYHFQLDLNTHYIKSIRHEFDETHKTMNQQPLLHYIKPNNVYYIHIGSKADDFPNAKRIMIIPHFSATKYQEKGPLILTRTNGTIWRTWAFYQTIFNHFMFDCWEETLTLSLFDDEKYEDIQFYQFEEYWKDKNYDIYSNKKCNLSVYIYNRIGWEKKTNNKVYHFKYNQPSAFISFTENEIMINCNNDFYKLKRFLMQQIVIHRSKMATDWKDIGERLRDIIIYKPNDKYDDEFRYKWPDESQVTKAWILPMHTNYDKRIKRVEDIKQDILYYIYVDLIPKK